MSSMGDLGVRGGTVLDALAHQSQDLQDLAGELTTVLAALDTGQGQIQQVVSEADRLTGATAGQQQAVATTMQLLPGVLGSAKSASGSLTQLGASLGPVARGLQTAAPGLNQALLQLPQTTNQLQTLLPILNTTLGEAPATLTRVPSTGNDAAALIPPTQDGLQNINPMLDYLRPYGHDIIQIVSNIGAGTSHLASDGETFIAVPAHRHALQREARPAAAATGHAHEPLPPARWPCPLGPVHRQLSTCATRTEMRSR